MERRLAAILAADIVGYSRLMRAGEEGTLARLKALHRELFEPTVREHRGRIQTLHLAGHGDYRMLGAPVRCGGAEAPANPAPGLGQHTDELLRDLGYDDAKLDRLRRAKAI